MWLKERLQEKQNFLNSGFLNKTQGRSQCQVNKEGLADASIKELEGKLQAVNDILRCLKRVESQSDVKSCLEELHQNWSILPEPSRLWTAFKLAGLDEIENAIEQVVCASPA
jgi:DNA mismatch repair ATPase MutS